MLRRYTNTAPPSLLQVEVNDSATELDIGDTSNYPDKFPFVVAIERGTESEEACLVTAKTATTLTVTRGYDGTQAIQHPGLDSSGELASLVEHTTAAIDYREAQIPFITESERDALDDTDDTEVWDGRMVYNADRRSVEVAHFDGGLFDAWHGLLPTGTVLPFSSGVTPPGFLRCDGAAHLRADYPGLSALYDAEGFPFGSGDGSTTFNVPDLRQKFPLGVADAGTGAALGDSGGAVDHAHTQPAHVHSQPTHAHTNPNVNSNGSHAHSQGSTDSAGSHAHSQGNTGAAGSHAHSNPVTDGSSVGSQYSSFGTRGLRSYNDSVSHDHTFSDSFTTSGDSHSHTSGGYGVGHTGDSETHFINGSSGSDSHSHGGSVSGTTSVGGGVGDFASYNHSHFQNNTATQSSHAHSTPNTNSGGAHSHNLNNVNSGGSHAHSQGNTGSSGGDNTGVNGGDDTGTSNPPFLTLHYIVKT